MYFISVSKQLLKKLFASTHCLIIQTWPMSEKEKNWLLFVYIYKPTSENSQYFLYVLIDFLDFHSNKCDKKPVLWKVSWKSTNYDQFPH